MAKKPEQLAWDDAETKPIGSRAQGSDKRLPPKAAVHKPWKPVADRKIGMTDRIHSKYRD